MPYALVVHGGAGDWRELPPAAVLPVVSRAAAAGAAVLEAGGSALDAVIAAVVLLEDDPRFNAGTGSVLNLNGEVEMDAGVMTGDGLRSGNVAALQGVRNPVRVARAVMEQTPHVLLAGEGARRFARAIGVPEYDPVTPSRRERWRRTLGALRAGQATGHERLASLLQSHPALDPGTVGAVARDRHGRLAAASSTGGTALKLPGRVGDTPVPGAGHYATSAAAVSATGQGELMLRLAAAKSVCDAIEAGEAPGVACRALLTRATATIGSDMGLIALDRHGRVGLFHGTPQMPHAWTEGHGVQAAMACRQ